MASNSYLSSLSFFNDEYQGVSISEPGHTAQSAENEVRRSSHGIPRKPLKRDARSASRSPRTDDDESLISRPPTPCQTPMVQSEPAKNSHKFVRRRQLQKLLIKGFFRFTITITLTATLLWTLFAYSKPTVLTESQKRIFNTLVTALSMGLGIAIASSFKQVAIHTRWWILSKKKRRLLEVDAILECESLSSLAVLAVKSARNLKPKIVLACSMWIVINIAAQAGVAMLGLTYSLDNGIDYTRGEIGPIVFTDMNQSFAYSTDYSTTAASELAAHTYGEMAFAYKMNSTETSVFLPVMPLSAAPSTYVYWDSPDYFQYVFVESSANSDSQSNPINFYSNRSITTYGSCDIYPVYDNLNDAPNGFTVIKNGQNYTPIFESIGPNSTTYYIQLGMDCGERCKSTCAYENNGKAAFVVECNVTVSTVSNVTYLSQNVSDENALMAAGAIGLQGYQAWSNKEPMSQYQQFPNESTYGQFVGDGPSMASLMSRYAIGVFVTADQIMAEINDPVQGFLPLQGVTLSIDKVWGMWAIFISIVVSHLILFIMGSVLANKVVVVDDSYLAIALLLRPMTERIKEKGFLLGGERAILEIEDMDVLYGVTEERMEKDGGARGLEVSEQAERVGKPKAWEGWYF